jgi:hypothetical protein
MLDHEVALVHGAGGIGSTVTEAAPEIVDGIVGASMIGKAATFEGVGNVAVFAASDQARMMTAAPLNICGGAVIATS